MSLSLRTVERPACVPICVFCSILVGAPNESGPNDTRTGAVYQCELEGGDNNCSRVGPFDSYTGADANSAWSEP